MEVASPVVISIRRGHLLRAWVLPKQFVLAWQRSSRTVIWAAAGWQAIAAALRSELALLVCQVCAPVHRMVPNAVLYVRCEHPGCRVQRNQCRAAHVQHKLVER